MIAVLIDRIAIIIGSIAVFLSYVPDADDKTLGEWVQDQ